MFDSDIKRKAKRWDTKQVDGLKKKRDQYVKEIKDLNTERRKDSNLQDMKSQITGLEARLKYTKRDKETIVCFLLFFFLLVVSCCLITLFSIILKVWLYYINFFWIVKYFEIQYCSIFTDRNNKHCFQTVVSWRSSAQSLKKLRFI